MVFSSSSSAISTKRYHALFMPMSVAAVRAAWPSAAGTAALKASMSGLLLADGSSEMNGLRNYRTLRFDRFYERTGRTPIACAERLDRRTICSPDEIRECAFARRPIPGFHPGYESSRITLPRQRRALRERAQLAFFHFTAHLRQAAVRAGD